MLPQRVIQLTIGEVDVSALDAEFQIHSDLSKAPNTCNVTVFNLSESTRAKISAQAHDAVVRLAAGYAGQPLPVLFEGKLRVVNHTHDHAEWRTTLSSGDGDSGHVSASFAAGSILSSMIKQVAGELGRGAEQMLSVLPGAASKIPTGLQVHGRTMDELDRLVRKAGGEVSVQKGQLQVLPEGQPLPGVVVLEQATGLVGSPEVGESTKKKKKVRTVKFTHLLSHEIVPGRHVEFRTAHVQGRYRVVSVDYVGQTHGASWYVNGECQ